jgi:hypothetical protein
MMSVSYNSESSKSLHLTQDEAMALLDMCLCTRMDDDAMRASAIHKLAALCRDFLRSDPAEAA